MQETNLLAPGFLIIQADLHHSQPEQQLLLQLLPPVHIELVVYAHRVQVVHVEYSGWDQWTAMHDLPEKDSTPALRAALICATNLATFPASTYQVQHSVS